MPSHAGELPIPIIAQKDRRGVEIARIWASRGGQEVTLRTDIWDDPAAWGHMLVNFARHVASAYAEEDGLDPEETLQRIREGFEAEWDNPSHEPDPLDN